LASSEPTKDLGAATPIAAESRKTAAKAAVSLREKAGILKNLLFGREL
jgi:hypothetical protein